MNIGLLKIAFDRWRSYLGAGQLLIVILMAIGQGTIAWWQVIVGIVLSIALEWVDMRYVIRAEYSAGQRRNEELNNKLERIEHMLKQLGAK